MNDLTPKLITDLTPKLISDLEVLADSLCLQSLVKQLTGLYISSYKLDDSHNIELDINELVTNLNDFHIGEYVGAEEVDELVENINNIHISPEYKIEDVYNVNIEKTLNGKIKVNITPKCTIEFMKENPFVMPRYVDAF